MPRSAARASWEKEPGRRNEALDCRVYARAAASTYGLDRFEARRWQRMEEVLAVPLEEEQEMLAARLTPRPPARQVIQSGYMIR
jgi:phage terminase large subunit GpA-like protein